MGRPDEIKAVPVRRPGRWIAAAIVLLLAAAAISSIVSAKGFQWHVVGQYLFDSRILHGALTTMNPQLPPDDPTVVGTVVA